MRNLFIFCTLILGFFISSCVKEKRKIILSSYWNEDSSEEKYDRFSNKKKERKELKKSDKALHCKTKKTRTIIIAGSKPGSNKYNVAGSICKFINMNPKSNIRCLVEPNPTVRGAIKNSKYYDFIISQSNIDNEILKNSSKKLTSIFSLYEETFTLLVSSKSNINSINNLSNKKVYFGSKSSSSYQALMHLVEYFNMKIDDIKKVKGIAIGGGLCSGDIDAIFNSITHPDPDLDDIIGNCGVKIIPIDKEAVKKLINEYDYYIDSKINKNLYHKQSKDIESFGITVNLIATEKVDPKLVYDFVKLIYEDMPRFKMYNKNLLSLSQDKMTLLGDGLVLPIHKGALKYYKEKNINISIK